MTKQNKNMKIYTSYFANLKEVERAHLVPINIALWPPRFYRGKSLSCVAPTRSILKDTKSDEEYISRYKNEILLHLDVKRLLHDIEQLTEGKDAALLCYEKPGELCHRHLLAEFMNERGCDVKELKKKEQQLSIDFK